MIHHLQYSFMTKPEQIPIQKPINYDELLDYIRTEKNARVLKRLYFVKYRYEGNSVKVSSERVGVSRNIGHIWQRRWNEDGYDGLIPKYSGGRPSKLSDERKVQLKKILKERDDWTTKEIKYLILKEFDVEYSLMQIHRILKKFGMKFAKPYPHDYRKPVNAEETLKKTSSNR